MRVLILGATSAIAQAAARIWAARSDDLVLVGRNEAHLRAIADDLRVRGADSVEVYVHDLEQPALPEGSFDVVLLAQGLLQGDPERVLRTNLVAPVQLLEALEPRLRGGDRVAALSSVAGDRGRAANAVYGASKAGLDAYLSALRQRLFRRGVHVVTLKPGFVDTPMTAGMSKGPLFATPAQVARGLVRAVDRGATVVYLPWWWRLVMLVVRSIPESIFRKLSF